ncbi:hypothetical protein [Cerasicoccus arenae]|uniref:Verru_Chthon cassette protein A n=1 Tax=Cerasicoccus arenae TaxID=424488 RepID=A0A8J3DIG7_9BACT|nr:hypothetical protein [Cerasicoccus arenae]MBK1858131.1 hypothetical protein [Cerasicoccus arenae]GHB96684.1 hypothetical protein GCM10007047_10740 [Cerasicoccus arenae]
MNTPRQKSECRKRQGFALVLSLSLMSFLVLLILSLAILTKLEIQSSANMMQRNQARQNALTALNIALGELQKYAGPDQRITARADLQHGDTSANPYWTGVYGNSIAASYTTTPEQIATDLTDANKVDSQGSSARLLSWLVSGNEMVPFNPTTDIGTSGEIINAPDASSIPFNPVTVVSNLNDSTAITATDLVIQDVNGSPRAARILVGDGVTADSSDFVAVPLVDLENNTGAKVGGYAWWIGDEGVKARANLPLVTESNKKLNAFVSASRTAVELMSDGGEDDDSLVGDRIDVAYNPEDARLERIEQLEELPLVSLEPVDFSTKLKYRFHDLTTRSQSVIVDTYAGGLKRDLSIILDESFIPAVDDPTADVNRLWVPHTGDTLGFTPGFAIPTWRHLRSFAQTRVPTTGTDAFKMEPILPAHDKADNGGETFPDHVGIAPVITYFSMGFRAAYNNPIEVEGIEPEIHLNLYPLVVIWNPYNFTLKPPPDSEGYYEVGIYPTYNVKLDLEAFVARDSAVPEWTNITSFDFQRDTDGDRTKTEFIRFRLKCPEDGIPPGQSLIFSLPDDSTALYDQKNVLYNKDPLDGYVSVPFTPTGSKTPIKALSEEVFADYRLVNNYERSYDADGNVTHESNRGSSFSNNGGGAMYIYIGEPVEQPIYVGWPSPDGHIVHNPSWGPRRWYNTHQQIGWDNNKVKVLDEASHQQEPGQLQYKPPLDDAYVFLTQALFSGQGQNAQLDTDQFMFTTRWLAQGNMRAVRSGRTRRDGNFNVLYTATTGNVKTPWQKFSNGSGSEEHRTSAGNGHDWIANEPVDAILYEFPYEDQPIFSIGQLQHANLSLVGAYPSYPIGNSLADFRLNEKSSTPIGYQLARIDATNQGGINQLRNDQRGYYDISFLLNRTLWDQYYFSTVPATGDVPDTLPNTRYVEYNDSVDLQDPDKSAAGLMLNGGFNINSTSEQAWRAVLGATNQLKYDPEDALGGNPLNSAFSRFSRPNSDDDLGSDTSDAMHKAWDGYRTLTEEEIAQLARNIVVEIRNRGPFVSLSDFINRRLVDNPNTNDATVGNTAHEHEDFRGTIQAAIDRTATHSDDDGNDAFPSNDGTGLFWQADEMATRGDSTNYNHNQGTQYAYYNQARLEGADVPARPYSNRSSFAPKYISQADILATIGSTLSARSDTFVIRAYGEVVDPFNPAEVRSQAWCEAVVQRYPEYINDTVNAPEDNPSKLDALNKQFGRKFKILSFRWLSADEV